MKRILSLILAVCMIAGLLPAVTLVSAEESPLYTYDFTTAVLDADDAAARNSTAQAGKATYTTTYKGLTPKTGAAGTDTWYVANTQYVCNATSSGGNYSEVTSDGIRFLLYMTRYFDEKSTNSYKETASWTAGNCTHTAIVINIPKAGKYNLSMFNNAAHTWGAHTEVRFAKTDKISLSTTDVTALYNAGDTQLLGWHDSSTVHDGTAASPAEKFVVTVPEGQEGSYALIFATPNGAFDRNRTAMRANDAISTASEGYQAFNLTRIELSEYVISLKVAASISPAAIEVDENVKITVSAATSDGSELPGEVTYTYTPADEDIVSIAADGTVTGLSAGETDITITAASGTISGEATVSVTVTEPLPDTVTLTYDFNQLDGETSNGVTITAASAAYRNTSGTWAYAGLSIAKISTQASYGMNIGTTQSVPYSALKINIPYAGSYSARLVHHKNRSSGGIGDVFLIPADADVSSLAAITGNADKIGLFTGVEYYNEAKENVFDAETDAADIFVPAGGEYYLVFHATDTKSGNYGAYPHKLILEGEDTEGAAVMYAESSVSAKEIKAGETAQIIVSGWMTDGSELSDAVAYTYTPADGGIVSIDADGRLTGVADGRTDITVIASVGERSVSSETSIIVDSAEKAGYRIKYNIADAAKANVTAKPEFASLTRESNYGFWGYLSNSANQASPDWAFAYCDTGIRIAQNRWMAFEIYVPAAGIYSMYIEHGENNAGCDVGVYVSPGDAADSPIEEKYYVNSFNCDNDSVTTNFTELAAEPSYVSNVELAKGLNRVAFKVPKGSDYGIAGSIILDGGDKTLLMHADMEISAGGKITLTGLMSDGSDADMTQAKVTYTSSNTEVAEAPTSGNALVIKALGTTTVTAEIKMGDADVITLEKEFTVTKLPAAFAGVDTQYRFFERNGSWDPIKNPVDGFEKTDRSEDIRGITYKYTGVDGVGNWQYNTSGPTWIPGKYAVFMYYGTEAIAGNYLRLQMPKVGDWVAFDIQVPAAGRYVAELLYSVLSYSASVSDIYVLPKNETTDTIGGIDALLDEAHYIATVDYLDSSATEHTAKTKELGEIEFESAGEYILVFKRNDGGRGGYINPKMLTLHGVNGMHYADIAVEKQELEIRMDGGEVYNESVKVNVTATRLDGSAIAPEDYEMTIESSDPAIVDAASDGTLTAKSEGKATISVRVEDAAGKTASAEIEISVVDNTGIKESVLSLPEQVYVGGKAQTEWTVTLGSGNKVIVPPEEITYTYSPEGIASVDAAGSITGISAGSAEITATAEFKGEEINASAKVTVAVDDRKTEPTYYTYDMREAILENISKFDWARSTQKGAVTSAEKYLQQYMYMYEAMPGEGIPRTTRVGLKNDPEQLMCRYCGADLSVGYGGGLSSGFSVDIMSRPWKVQCQVCKRIFPSNDFEGFYELGRDQAGYFDVDRARRRHHEMLFHADGEECTCEAPAEEFSDAWYEFYGYGDPEGYLYNELYSELRDPTKETYNKDPYKKDRDGNYLEIDGDRWGVDDGFGYRPGREAAKGCDEVHTYIANYNLELHDEIGTALLYLTRAYLYTGDIKYGRAGAILTDRLADLYPSYDMRTFDGTKYSLNDGNRGTGKTHGNISDASYAQWFALACDAFFPAIDDAEVVAFLSSEASRRGLENDKSTPEKIWDNWESGILDEIFYAIQRTDINGNFGMKQNALACAAIVRDREPMTSEMIEFIYATDTTPNSIESCTGGSLMTQLIDIVDRDGNNNESSPNYNSILIQNLYLVAEVLAYYKGEEGYNLYDNPKFAELFVGLIPTLATENKSFAIGDGGATANTSAFGYLHYYYDAFDHLKDTEYGPKIANYLYMRNGFSAEGLNYGIQYKDPERLEQEILDRIDPEYKQESTNMTGYGLAILRDGVKSKNATEQTAVNTLRDAWIYYGGGNSHKHYDALTIGMDAYGLDIAPDLGEPEEKTLQPNRLQWVRSTISHNTVLVNEKDQSRTEISSGIPHHFDDAGKVKVMDAEAPTAYNDTSEYRRVAVMVEANDEVSYTVDFFRVKGGTHHSYSFHSQAENAYPAEGLDFTTVYDENGSYVTGAQVALESGEYQFLAKNEDGEIEAETVYMNKGDWLGSYADIQWRVGEDPNSPWIGTYTTVYPRGYSWMGKVRRDTELESGKFAVEFDVKDYRKASSSSDGVRLRMTQVNDFVPDEVVITAGWVPQRTVNVALPKTLDYVLVNRESDGESLDSLYTTVFEPYKNERYISEIDAVEITADGEASENDVARAVKVTHTSGRADYIVYATNNGVTYTVTDRDADGNVIYEFSFRGAIGVLSTSGGEVIYRYVNDGDIIGEETEAPARYTGTVAGFSRDLTFDNYIDVNMSCDDISTLAGKYIYIANDGVRNAVYKIESASKNSDGTIRLDIGTVSPIRGHKDKQDVNSGYIYDIAANQKSTIPMSFVDEGSPVVESPGDVSTSAGKTITLDIGAESPIEGQALEYIGMSLPRGASIDSETGVFTWRPDGSQVGDNHVAVTVRDEAGRESTIHFTVSVYGATTGSTGQGITDTAPDSSDTENTGSTGASGGGGTSGGGSADGATTTPDDTATDNNDQTDVGRDETSGQGSGAPSAGGTSDTRFIDLGNYAWAEDSINSLADDGIIKGTTHNTYSPASSITRADYAILLVRAFELASEDTTNFADVSASDYFAPELAIARNTGIVNGIGDNKYAPRRTITRQDMMVVIYRALDALGLIDDTEWNDTQALPYEDFDSVADYAKAAVSYLVSNGLVNGKNGRIAPTDYTTRAEVAVLLRRILDYVK